MDRTTSALSKLGLQTRFSQNPIRRVFPNPLTYLYDWRLCSSCTCCRTTCWTFLLANFLRYLLKEEISHHESTAYIKHGSTSESVLHACEEAKQHQRYKKVVTKAREHYRKDKCKDNWMKTHQLTPSERGERAWGTDALLHIDHQRRQSKLILSWRETKQPGSTYYLQKVSRHLWASRKEQNTVHRFDELKNTDHTVSFLSHFLKNIHGSQSF